MSRSTSAQHVPFATAEDLIIHKLFAGRPRDLEDAAGVVRRKGPDLDWTYLRAWAGPFAEVDGREGLPSLLEGLREEQAPRTLPAGASGPIPGSSPGRNRR